MDYVGMIGGAIAGWFGNEASRAAADANTRLSKVNAQANNSVRSARNAFEAAKGALSRYVQAENNNRRLEAGGQALEANLVNARRQQDVDRQRSFSDQIAQAEQRGAMAASAANVGAVGGVVDMVNSATALRDSIITEQTRRMGEMKDSDTVHRAATIASQTIQGMDSSIILDSLDYSRDVAQKSPKVSAFAAAVRGAFPYARDALGKESANPTGSKNTGVGIESANMTDEARSEFDALKRDKSGWDFSDGPASFQFNDSTDRSPYELWGSNDSVKFGASSDTSDSIYSLYSR